MHWSYEVHEWIYELSPWSEDMDDQDGISRYKWNKLSVEQI